MPPSYGNWNSVAKRFRRWVNSRIWEAVLEVIIDEDEYEWIMIDASHAKVHPHACGAVGENQDMKGTKGGSIPKYTLPWILYVCDKSLVADQGIVLSESLLQQIQQQTAKSECSCLRD